MEEQNSDIVKGDQLLYNSIPVRKIQNVAFLMNGKVAQLALDGGCEGDCIRAVSYTHLTLPTNREV